MGFELIPVQELLKEFYFCTVGWVLWEDYKQPCLYVVCLLPDRTGSLERKLYTK